MDLSIGARAPDPGVVALLRALAAVELSVFAARIATLVMLSTASLGLRAGAFPRWLAVFTYVVGVAEFINVMPAEPTLYVFPAWIALVSFVLLVRRPQIGAA